MAAPPPGTATVDAATALPDDAVEVARVLGAWGIKGGIRIKPYAADPQALFSSKRWYLLPPDTPGPRPLTTIPALLRVVTAKMHGDGVVATAQELPDRTAAEAMKGARIFISRASFPTPDHDEFYWVDLIGMSVVNGQSVDLGVVVGLIETGPSCVLRVRHASPSPVAGGAAADDAGEVLIPFVGVYVVDVDTAARRISVDWETAEPDADEPASDDARPGDPGTDDPGRREAEG